MSTGTATVTTPAPMATEVPKKNSKSRNGCLTCKKKRLKCDETKPACLNCTNKKIECGGYSTNFRWKSFEETTTSQKILKKTGKQSSPVTSSSGTVSDARGDTPKTSGPSSKKERKTDPKSQSSTATATATAPAMSRSYSMPESAQNISPGFQHALQQAALSIAGRSPEELAKQSELMSQGKNPYGKHTTESTRRGSMNPSEAGSEDPSATAMKRRATEDPMMSHDFSHGLSPEMSYSLNLHAFAQNAHSQYNFPQQTQPSKRRQTVSVLDQPVLSPGATSAGSPSLSTLVRAFTEFDSMNVPNTPSNIDPLSPTPRILELSREDGSAIINNNGEQDDRDNEDRESLDESQLVMAHLQKRSMSMDSALSGSSIPQYRKELLNFSHSLSNTRSGPMSVQVPYSPTSGGSPFTPLSIPKSILPSDFDKVFQAFDKYTCAIMSIKNGPTENPWRTLVWPLALQHSVLYKSLASMSLFHVSRGDESLKKLAVNYMRQSMHELAEGLVQQTIPNEVALATCLSLAITDSWEKHTTTGIAHLKGARSIINKLDREQIQKNEPLYKFLINVFVYYDVLARMSSLQPTDTDYDVNGKLIQNLKRLKAPGEHGGEGSPTSSTGSGDHNDQSSDHSGHTSQSVPNFNELFGSRIFPEKDRHEDESVIDPLLGCAPGLFLMIGRVASFITKVRNMPKLSLGTVSAAAQLKNDLASWKPDQHIKENVQLEDPLCDVSSCITTAEAYRYSTLLYLQQAVPEIASQSNADLAEKVLMLLASIPTSSKTCIVHMFPLLVASCEMSSAEDREWVRERWRLLADKMWLGTIDRSVEIVQEVWRRKDVLAARAQEEQNDGSGNETWDLIQDRIDVLTRNRKREDQGINSWAHWSTVTKEWKWEVLFG